MKLLYLEMNNFQSFEEAKIDLKKMSVTSIVGNYVNNLKRSNGSGKSSIFDGILWALFGKSRTQDEDSLIRLGQDTVQVVLEYEIGNVNCYIERIKGKKNKLNYFENDVDLSEGKRETQELIIKRLGMRFELFVATLFFQQESADDFTSSTPTERKQYLKELFQLDIYDHCYDAVNDKIKKVEELLNKEQGILDFLKENLDDDFDIKVVEEHIATKKIKLEKIKFTLNDLKDCQKEYLESKGGIKQLEINKQKCDDGILNYNDSIKTLNKKIGALSEGQAEDGFKDIEEVKKDLKNNKNKKIELENQRIELREQISAIKSIQDHVRKSLNEIKDVSVCPVCESKIDKNTKNALMEKWNFELDTTQLTKITNSLNKIETNIREVNSFIGKGEVCVSDYNEWSKDKIVEEKELKRSEEKLKELQNKVVELKNDLSDIAVKLKKYNKLKDFSDDIEEYEGEEQELDHALAELKNEIEEYEKNKKKIKTCEINTEELRIKLNDWQINKNIFGKNGIVAQIIKESVEEIQENTNRILNDINGGELQVIIETEKENKSGIVKDSLEIKVVTGQGDRFYESFSGGEKAILNFSIRMGLSQVLSKINSVNFNCIILDEIFGALDEFNSQKMVEVINYLKKQFNQIFIISHTSIKDSFYNTIRVLKNNQTGISKIAEVS